MLEPNKNKWTSWKVCRYLEGSISRIEPFSSETIDDKSMVDYLQDHFNRYKGQQLIEYERENNLFNWVLCNWNVSERSPVKYKSAENLSENLVCIFFDSAFDDCNEFKYICSPMEFSSIDDIFYVGLAKTDYTGLVKVYEQNIYVPLKKIKKILGE